MKRKLLNCVKIIEESGTGSEKFVNALTDKYGVTEEEVKKLGLSNIISKKKIA